MEMEALYAYQNSHHQLMGVTASGYVINLMYVRMYVPVVEQITLMVGYVNIVNKFGKW